METTIFISTSFCLAWLSFCIYWMIKLLSFIKQSRIIHSMTLKVLLKYCESKGLEIDINKIQQEVERSVG